MSSIQLSGVGVQYPGGALGLDDVTLDISPGEFVTLIGPSGSGKTTLLRAIAGFVAPSSGTIRLHGEPVASATHSEPPERRHLGMVFQQHAIWPHWNVGRNVAYPLRLAGYDRQRRSARVAEVLELVGLGGLERRNPATLSGGQRQRVALARALAASPRILLLDEALSALDEPLRARLRIELKALSTEIGLTVVHVTHDRDEALALADRVVLLDQGRISQVGTPDELAHRPSSPAVASFLSDATTVDGTLDATGFVASDATLRLPLTRVTAMNSVDASSLHPTSRYPTSRHPTKGTLVVLPDGLETHQDGDLQVTVVSSLYGRAGHQVVVRVNGVDFQSRVPGAKPEVGSRLPMRITQALFYADPSARSSDPVAPAQAMQAVIR